MKRSVLLFCLGMIYAFAAAQDQPAVPDSVIELESITVRAYQYERQLLDVPTSVGFVGPTEFERFNATSFLPAINSVPGVRMEERSPGSYRLSVRGSTLRSPFGIRNVKVYFNGLPFTDPGGNTYLNLLDVTSVNSLEIIKGPGGSLYGAGTGGVLLLNNSERADQQQLTLAATGGSFGTYRYEASYRGGGPDLTVSARYAHQASAGYREQTRMARDVLQADANFGSGRRKMLLTLLYADLFYETPGGLTKAQFDADPAQARPAGGPNPGAVEQRATVFNKTFYTSFSHDYRFNERWSSNVGVYGSFSNFENPSIRNVEKRVESSIGGRTTNRLTFRKGTFDIGAEFQSSFSPVQVFDNNQGISGAIQSSDEIRAVTAFVFAQSELFLPADFFLTLAASLNFNKVGFARLTDTPPFVDDNNFDPVLSPRIALLKKINPGFSVFASFSEGYSPPTVAELYPSTSVFNSSLAPERGENYELGIRGSLFNGQLSLDLAGYVFRLKETIVIRRDDDGAEFFVNSGRTSQKGIEAAIRYLPSTSGPFRWKPWLTYTYNHYRFEDYVQGTDDYSGNDLTGVAPHIIVAGVDVIWRKWFAYLSYTHTAAIPLDDANLNYADPYDLLNFKAGINTAIGRATPVVIFVGADNLLDETYSLGHDLNAFGGRFYNAAFPRNYFLGINVKLNGQPQ